VLWNIAISSCGPPRPSATLGNELFDLAPESLGLLSVPLVAPKRASNLLARFGVRHTGSGTRMKLIDLLLRLYPPEFRDRYGDEMPPFTQNVSVSGTAGR
jgi:hypothetical protein